MLREDSQGNLTFEEQNMAKERAGQRRRHRMRNRRRLQMD